MNAALDQFIRLVGTKLAMLPKVSAEDYEGLRAYWGAADAILDHLEAEQSAKVSRRGDNWTLSLGGVRASSTGGAVSLLRNWKAGAERRLAGGAE
ncbi:hypothetical protein OSH11_21555 [Kaistia dalseonensis]|uniref:Uncharacterized protein n=1 Tax=Kaistia dalseonensis TaxID=410840 RepID=A0ABU0HCE1_9HYPH|nr:hypothetical protein [Kaistia dalseonensis]MCX5497298.1 hypothetical protein [Kaistia dalseonensis]MDQ0439935.1 hypothetical protein [Kaistia dalseonensis]